MTAEQVTKSMTETELLTLVSVFYRTQNLITIEKAIKVFEIEFGFRPDLIENTESTFVDTSIFKKYNGSDFLEAKYFEYLYELQQSGATNMFAARPYLLQVFDITQEESKEIMKFYISYYTELFFPEDCL
jgi:hypothetical protein